jgi:hypothetical protein
VNRARVATLALTVALAATGVAVAPGARAQGAPRFKAPNGPEAAAFSAPGVLATVLLVSA